MNWISQPWPWYVAGPLIGLIVPALLLIGNKTFGISSSLRHVCAACFPSNLSFFKYDWKKESWNLFFVGGIMLGGFLTAFLMPNEGLVTVSPELQAELASYGINDYSGLVPVQLFNWHALFSLKGLLLMVFGGFLVGFGTLCWRLHLWPCYFRHFQFAMGFGYCYLLLHGRRFFNGQPDFTNFIKTLKRCLLTSQ